MEKKAGPSRFAQDDNHLVKQVLRFAQDDNHLEQSGRMAKGGEDTLYLLFGDFEGTGVVDYEIGGFDFFFVGNLGCHTTRYFGTGGVFGDSETAGEAQNALFGLAGDDDQTVKASGGVRFED